jgi:hypothetical protein
MKYGKKMKTHPVQHQFAPDLSNFSNVAFQVMIKPIRILRYIIAYFLGIIERT